MGCPPTPPRLYWPIAVAVLVAACGSGGPGATAGDPALPDAVEMLELDSAEVAPEPDDAGGAADVATSATGDVAASSEIATADIEGVAGGEIIDDQPSEDAAPDAADIEEDAPFAPSGWPALPPPDDELPEDVLTCQASDESWVARVVPALWGRRPYGRAEILMWAEVVGQAGRGSVVQAMMADEASWLPRWTDVLMDHLRVNRTGDKMHDTCFGTPIQPKDTGGIALWVRDHHAAASGAVGAFNMRDLIHSSLRLDDLSPVFRGYLFAMLVRPLTGANVAALEMELSRRNDFGEVFEGAYLDRKRTCMACHNSTFSVTGSADPELDRTWEIPGHVETAIFGAPTGRPEEEIRAMLRHIDVVVESLSGDKPWGWSNTCGRFRAPDEVKEDPLGVEAFFVEPWGTTASVWRLEELLREGFETLRGEGVHPDPESLAVDGAEAFAWLTWIHLIDVVFEELHGHPLTIANHFPRNRAQRDRLWSLAHQAAVAGFSLKTVVAEAVLDPRFAQTPPSEGCGAAYPMRPIYAPFSVHEESVEEQGNGPGDRLERQGARTLSRAVSAALGQAETPAFTEDEDVLALQGALGTFLKDAEPGFTGTDVQGLLAWEDAHGRCGGGEAGDEPEAADLIDALAEAAVTGGHTLGDAIAALKDRLIQAPAIAEAEAPLLEDLLGAPLGLAAAEVEGLSERLRRVCGALVESPDFLLDGHPAGHGPAPALLLEGLDPQSLCEGVAALWPSSDGSIVCSEGVPTWEGPSAP